MNYWKLGCRWYGGAPLFFKYLLENNIIISWSDKKFNINDTVLLTDGFTAIGVAKVLSTPTSILDLPEFQNDFETLEIPINNKDLIVFKADIFELEKSEQFTYQLQKGICQIQVSDIQMATKELLQTKISKTIMKNLNNLLTYKKQIILQGPPGTGKTRLAKQLVKEIFESEITNELDENYFGTKLKKGYKFSFKNGKVAIINKIVNDKLILDIKNNNEEVSFKISDIFDCFKTKDYSLKDFVDYNSYAVRTIVSKIVREFRLEKQEKQFKIIQFHPSYTYEDFVRGITSIPNTDGEGILYKTENKTLGLFAQEALNNYLDSKKDNITISNEIKVKESFEKFKEFLNDEIEESSGYFQLTENVGLITTDDEQAFRYKGKNDGWLKNGNRMLFKDILQAYSDRNTERQDIKKNNLVSGLARQHASYFIRVVNLFQQFIANEEIKTDSETLEQKIELKNYILIIDEINRANLSSVLGELIYALEYRGEEVESMYEVDSSQKLILPPNLYIIGTMNTADRSVGHIDYAIRRRFAFVEVLPKDLSIDMEAGQFYTNLFTAVKSLFTSDDYKTKSDFISQEFEPKDVALGHSYFIDKSEQGGDEKIRWEYEIKPILIEYVRDGVLKQSALQKISEIEESL